MSEDNLWGTLNCETFELTVRRTCANQAAMTLLHELLHAIVLDRLKNIAPVPKTSEDEEAIIEAISAGLIAAIQQNYTLFVDLLKSLKSYTQPVPETKE